LTAQQQQQPEASGSGGTGRVEGLLRLNLRGGRGDGMEVDGQDRLEGGEREEATSEAIRLAREVLERVQRERGTRQEDPAGIEFQVCRPSSHLPCSAADAVN
jgi:hypothetical protein